MDEFLLNLSKTGMERKRLVGSGVPPVLHSTNISKRLWSALCESSESLLQQNGQDDGGPLLSKKQWSSLSKLECSTLAHALTAHPLTLTSKNTNKEEFTTSGGISLKEISFQTFQSKKSPGLFCVGGMLDVDGVTGGYNFMGCWAAGYISGGGVVDYLTGGKAGKGDNMLWKQKKTGKTTVIGESEEEGCVGSRRCDEKLC